MNFFMCSEIFLDFSFKITKLTAESLARVAVSEVPHAERRLPPLARRLLQVALARVVAAVAPCAGANTKYYLALFIVLISNLTAYLHISTSDGNIIRQ